MERNRAQWNALEWAQSPRKQLNFFPHSSDLAAHIKNRKRQGAS